MRKALITKEQEEAIEFIKENKNLTDLEDVIKIVSHGGYNMACNKKCFPLNVLSIEELVLAWNGYYEVEKTPEEIIIETINSNSEYINNINGKIIFDGVNRALGFNDGVKFVNDTLKLGLKLN